VQQAVGKARANAGYENLCANGKQATRAFCSHWARAALFLNERFFQMTLSETLAAIAKLHRDAAEIGRDLNQHVAAEERDPVKHGRLHRLHRVVADLCFALCTPCPRQVSPA
jgi:hypothetical protein